MKPATIAVLLSLVICSFPETFAGRGSDTTRVSLVHKIVPKDGNIAFGQGTDGAGIVYAVTTIGGQMAAVTLGWAYGYLGRRILGELVPLERRFLSAQLRGTVFRREPVGGFWLLLSRDIGVKRGVPVSPMVRPGGQVSRKNTAERA